MLLNIEPFILTAWFITTIAIGCFIGVQSHQANKLKRALANLRERALETSATIAEHRETIERLHATVAQKHRVIDLKDQDITRWQDEYDKQRSELIEAREALERQSTRSRSQPKARTKRS